MIISLFLITIDQITKRLVISQNLPHQQNSNLFFFSIPLPLLIIVSTIIIFILTIWLKNTYKQKNRLSTLGILLILTGGLSNLYDRVILNYVIDWIYLPFSPFSVINLADLYITIGIFLTVVPVKNLKSAPPKFQAQL